MRGREEGGGREGGRGEVDLEGGQKLYSHSDHFSHESCSFFSTRVIPVMCNVCSVHMHVRDCIIL